MPYINSLVFYAQLPSDEIELISLPPRNMAAALANGQLDAGPLPIYEVLKLGDEVVGLGDLCVASDGAAHSVLLFSEVPVEQLSGARIAVTSHTSTSVQLLRILLRDLWRVGEVQLVGPEEVAQARLIIGDEALTFRRSEDTARQSYECVYDLAEHWKDLTGLPFVFACWVAKRDVDASRLEQLLIRSFEQGISQIDVLASAATVNGYTVDEIASYIRNFTYRFGASERAAVNEFRIRLENLPFWEPPVMPYVQTPDPVANEGSG